MWILNRHSIDNGGVDVYPLYYIFYHTSESVPDLDTTPIKSIDDDEMDQLLQSFGLLGVYPQMLHA